MEKIEVKITLQAAAEEQVQSLVINPYTFMMTIRHVFYQVTVRVQSKSTVRVIESNQSSTGEAPGGNINSENQSSWIKNKD